MTKAELLNELERYSDNISITPKTLRKWHHIKRFPEIFVKVGGKYYDDGKGERVELTITQI